MEISGQLVDIHARDIYPAIIHFENGRITDISKVRNAPGNYILPGLTDAHIHIESSMITPGAFAMAAVKHGTTSVVSDPHEIANVLGIAGVEFMINDSRKVPLKFYFGAPSCVPATLSETSGATLGPEEVLKLLRKTEINYLSEMMNFPGVIYEDKEVIQKLQYARDLGKPVDGHAPGLSGDKLAKYVSHGISTDHECSNIGEAREKISLGMKILIREGSAAKNLEALKDLYRTQPGMLMLCSDDLHPEMLRAGHINKLISRLVKEGYDIFDVVRSATINPAIHYNLDSGLLRTGDPADIIVADSLENMNIVQTWIKGECVYSDGRINFSYDVPKPVNNFNCTRISTEDIAITNQGRQIRVIDAVEGELLTEEYLYDPGRGKFVMADTRNDILKIVVKDRYKDSCPAVGFIRGFGLKQGAFASSIAHDSHNIIAVGTDDHEIAEVINRIIDMKGGLALTSGDETDSVSLNIGGIMTTRSCDEIAGDYDRLNQKASHLGCTMNAPFMTLSFMALLVIPDLKIGDQGLFDVKSFSRIPLFVS